MHPGIRFGAFEISISIKSARISDLINANKNIRRLKAEQVALQFPNFGSTEECMIVCYSDASFANFQKCIISWRIHVFLYRWKKSLL